jgi:phosphoglycolate phosphatase
LRKTIYIDLDGTILDTSDRHYNLYASLVKKYSGVLLKKRTYWSLKRQKTSETEIYRISGFSPSTGEKANRERLEKIETTQFLKYDTVFPFVCETLENLSRISRLAVATVRRERNLLNWEMERFGLTRYFSDVFCSFKENADWEAKGELISADVLFDKESSVVVGDTEVDIKAGKLVGITTVAISGGMRTEEYLLGLKPSYILHDISELCYCIDYILESETCEEIDLEIGSDTFLCYLEKDCLSIHGVSVFRSADSTRILLKHFTGVTESGVINKAHDWLAVKYRDKE